MYAMQYEIALPADYDMTIIHRRVAEKGPLLDQFPGLGLKAYLTRERGLDGSPVNQYAPFYLWADIAGMNRFLWGGGGFENIVKFTGRVPVRHWTGVACLAGPARIARPRGATRDATLLPPDLDPTPLVAEALDGLEQRATMPCVHTAALAIDPLRWELITFTLWQEDAPQDAGTRYRVLHLSTPGLDRIAGSALRRDGAVAATSEELQPAE